MRINLGGDLGLQGGDLGVRAFGRLIDGEFHLLLMGCQALDLLFKGGKTRFGGTGVNFHVVKALTTGAGAAGAHGSDFSHGSTPPWGSFVQSCTVAELPMI